MSRYVLACSIVAALLPATATADMGAPGFHRIPHDIVIEIESDASGYQFWLVSARGLEPLDLVPGRPLVINGEDRTGAYRIAWIVAAPAGLIEKLGEDGFRKAREARWADKPNPLTPDVLESEEMDFLGSVPFYDSRERVIDRYRLEFVPKKELRLVWLEQNAGSKRVKVAWAVVGVLMPIAVLGGFWWVVRRAWRASKKL